MILFPLTIWLRIILLLSPSMSMSRVVTLWPSIKSVSNFQILFVCWFYNFFPSLKLHILMPYHILWCRILQFLWHEDHGRGQKLQLLEMTIKDTIILWWDFCFWETYLLLLSFLWYCLCDFIHYLECVIIIQTLRIEGVLCFLNSYSCLAQTLWIMWH